jgi:hypothetical protein
MEPQKKWHFEVYDPHKSAEWVPLFEIDEEQLTATQELTEALNAINSPIVARIAPKDSESVALYRDPKPAQNFD